MRQLAVDRRTFLKAAGLSAVGVGVAGQVLASREGGSARVGLPNQFAGDPITSQASALDFDRDRIHRFVADEIAYEPYAGVLRGAKTTLIGKAGNGADKAVLLAALLDASAIETRFVTGTLADDAVATLAATTADRDATFARAEAALRGDPTLPTPETAPAEPAIQAILDRLPEIDASVTAWASNAVDTSVRQITDALAGAGIALPAGPAPMPDIERTRHLWVQARSGTQWIDLDPTLAGTEPGQSIATLVGEPVAAVPDDLRHRLDIDLVLEKVTGAGVTQEAIIEHSRFADELTDVPIAIGHAKPGALRELGAGIDSMLLGGTRYLAILQAGPTAYIGLSPIVLSGGDADDPSAQPDPFAGVGDGRRREGEAVAEWLELRITAPDGTVTTARRTLFDRVGEAVRLAGPVDPAAIPTAELVDLDADHPAEFLPLTVARFLSVATGATALPPSDGPDIVVLGSLARMYHLARDATNARLSVDRGAAVHLSSPNVTMHAFVPSVDKGGALRASEMLDLLHRGFGALPVAGATADVPAGVLAGVTSHVAERLRGGAGLPADLASTTPDVSVGALFERAAADGLGIRVLRDPLPPDVGYPPEATAILAEALAGGWVAIAPARAVISDDKPRIGWWLVDPVSGATRDLMDDGRGAAMMEFGELVSLILAYWAGVLGLLIIGKCVMRTARTVSAGLSDRGLGRWAIAGPLMCG